MSQRKVANTFPQQISKKPTTRLILNSRLFKMLPDNRRISGASSKMRQHYECLPRRKWVPWITSRHISCWDLPSISDRMATIYDPSPHICRKGGKSYLFLCKATSNTYALGNVIEPACREDNMVAKKFKLYWDRWNDNKFPNEMVIFKYFKYYLCLRCYYLQ